MSCITVTEIDCETAVVVQEDSAEIVQVVSLPDVVVTEEDPANVVRVQEQQIVVTEADPEFVVSECKQGPPGADGLDGAGAVEIASGPVPVGDPVVADSIAIALYRSAKWIVTITDTAGGEYKSYEVLAVHKNTTALYSVYSLVGDKISVFTDVSVVGANLVLTLTNNHSNPIGIKVQRIATTI